MARALPGEVRGVLAVLPLRHSPGRVVPAPVMGGRATGLLFANQPRDLDSWFAGLKRGATGVPVWAVMAMWESYYLRVGGRIAKGLRSSRAARVENWSADRVGREELCALLAQGPRLAVYVGHGRPRGLCGYHGVRFGDLPDARVCPPCGTVICLACDTLKRPNAIRPFGYEWIDSGGTAAYMGSVDAVGIKPNARLAEEMTRVFQEERPRDLAALLRSLERRLADCPEKADAHRAFSTYRVLGNPLQSFW